MIGCEMLWTSCGPVDHCKMLWRFPHKNCGMYASITCHAVLWLFSYNERTVS